MKYLCIFCEKTEEKHVYRYGNHHVSVMSDSMCVQTRAEQMTCLLMLFKEVQMLRYNTKSYSIFTPAGDEMLFTTEKQLSCFIGVFISSTKYLFKTIINLISCSVAYMQHTAH